jgi:predicted nucleic acid-binding protein
MKDKLFLDTNLVMDLLGERDPFYDAIAKIVSLADQGHIRLMVSALSFATVYFLLSRFEDASRAKEKIRKFKVLVDTAEVNDRILNKGLASDFKDFEDALQYYCAMETACDVLITRNVKDFKSSTLPVLTPTEYLSSWRIS